MTNERAIELLHRISDSQFDGIHGDERREALSMAVRALSGDGDTISRQQAIDAVVSAMIDGADAELVEGVMELLPSAQPETHDKRTETHACDLINRQQAIDEIDEWIKAFLESGHKESAADACLIQDGIIQLPSAQPERKKGHWIRHITTGLGPKLNDTIECSECRIAFSTENMFRRSFCPNCGADMRGESDD